MEKIFGQDTSAPPPPNETRPVYAYGFDIPKVR